MNLFAWLRKRAGNPKPGGAQQRELSLEQALQLLRSPHDREIHVAVHWLNQQPLGREQAVRIAFAELAASLEHPPRGERQWRSATLLDCLIKIQPEGSVLVGEVVQLIRDRQQHIEDLARFSCIEYLRAAAPRVPLAVARYGLLLIRDPTPLLRQAGAAVLGGCPELAEQQPHLPVTLLGAALADADENVQMNSLWALARLGRLAEGATPQLAAAKQAPDRRIAHGATVALACVRGRFAPGFGGDDLWWALRHY